MTKDARCRYTLRLPATLYEQLGSESSKQGISINALILQILWEWAEKNQITTGGTQNAKD